MLEFDGTKLKFLGPTSAKFETHKKLHHCTVKHGCGSVTMEYLIFILNGVNVKVNDILNSSKYLTDLNCQVSAC